MMCLAVTSDTFVGDGVYHMYLPPIVRLANVASAMRRMLFIESKAATVRRVTSALFEIEGGPVGERW